MTDVLDESIFSDLEVAPTAPPPSDRVQCEHCDQNWPRATGNAAKALHTKRYHPEHWGGPTSKPKNSGGKRGRPRKDTAPRSTTTTTVPRGTGPRPVARRRPLGEMLARLVLQVGRVINSTVDGPTGAAIMFEAGALGEAVDRVIAGTFIDKPLQKGANVAEKFEPLVPLVTMPAMIFMLSRRPEMGPIVEGELREAIEDVLVQSMPLLRKRAARTKATIDAATELRAIDPELADSEDPIGDIMRSFFMQAPANAGATEDAPGAQ